MAVITEPRAQNTLEAAPVIVVEVSANAHLVLLLALGSVMNTIFNREISIVPPLTNSSIHDACSWL